MTDGAAVRQGERARAHAERYIGDLIYGANDGIITTFAIVAGVAGAALSPRVVIVLGVANLLADGFSMAASNVLAIRSRAAVERRNGAEEDDAGDGEAVRPLRHGAATFGAFVVAGSVPLLAYLLPAPPEHRFTLTIVLTLLTLFAVGAARTLVTRGRPLRDGLEMLAIGALAAAVAWGVGRFLAVTTGHLG